MPSPVILAAVAFVCCICIAVGIYFATKGGDSPVPAPVTPGIPATGASPSGTPAAGTPATAPTLSSLKYDFVGEGGCTEDVAAARTTCTAMAGADTMGQQDNGCWHCLKTVTTGGGPPTAYSKKLYSLSATGRDEQRIFLNNGSVSCTKYCGGKGGNPWNSELPVAWGGASCLSAGKNNNLACSYVAVDPATAAAVQLQCTCQKSPSTPWSTGVGGSATGTGPGP
jgi:hypothetical protein